MVFNGAFAEEGGQCCYRVGHVGGRLELERGMG